MKIIKIYTIVTLSIFSLSLIAQNNQGVSISENQEAPHSSAMLEVKASNKGVKVPEVNINSLSDNGAINAASIVDGLMIYNPSYPITTVTKGYYFWDQATNSWVSASESCIPCVDEDWKTIGSSGTLINGETIPFIYDGSGATINNATSYSGVFINGFNIAPLNLQPLAIKKMCNGYVHVKGYISATSPFPFFSDFLSLPSGYRPVFDIFSNVIILSGNYPMNAKIYTKQNKIFFRCDYLDPQHDEHMPYINFIYIDFMFLAGVSGISGTQGACCQGSGNTGGGVSTGGSGSTSGNNSGGNSN